MTTTGRCLCGAIQFEFAGEAVETTHCHCESCRRQTSSPVATFVTVHGSALRIIRGQPNEYASSPGVRRSFCCTCGSPIAYQSERHPGLVDLFAGTLTDPTHLSPSLTRMPTNSSHGSRCSTICRAMGRGAAARRRCASARARCESETPSVSHGLRPSLASRRWSPSRNRTDDGCVHT
jgi:hypothetical protein